MYLSTSLPTSQPWISQLPNLSISQLWISQLLPTSTSLNLSTSQLPILSTLPTLDLSTSPDLNISQPWISQPWISQLLPTSTSLNLSTPNHSTSPDLPTLDPPTSLNLSTSLNSGSPNPGSLNFSQPPNPGSQLLPTLDLSTSPNLPTLDLSTSQHLNISISHLISQLLPTTPQVIVDLPDPATFDPHDWGRDTARGIAVAAVSRECLLGGRRVAWRLFKVGMGQGGVSALWMDRLAADLSIGWLLGCLVDRLVGCLVG
jgi:hypothetical protein